MSLEFSTVEKEITSAFFQYRNTIIIFTEDKLLSNEFYVVLFKNLLAGTNIKVNDVFQIGTCKEVKKAYQNQVPSPIPKIYIIDGDIFVITSPQLSENNLYVLDRYCIENYLMEEDPIIDFLYNFDGTKSREKIKQDFDYQNMIEDNKDFLIDLFLHKALSQRLVNRFTVQSLGAFLSNGIVDPSKIDAENNRVKSRLMTEGMIPMERINSELTNLQSNFPSNGDNFLKIISGKDYLLELVKSHARNKLGINGGWTRDSIKLNLARSCSLTSLSPLRDKIVSIVNQPQGS